MKGFFIYLSEVITPKSYSAIRDILEKQIKSEEEERTFELEIICSGGTTRIFEMREQFIFEKKIMSEIHGIGRDISDHKRAEGERKESYKQLRDTLNKTVEALAMSVDSKGPLHVGTSKERGRSCCCNCPRDGSF